MPRQSDKECIPSNQLSSIGFVGFILAVINASMNIVNNANSNNNNRNNNNNENNDNNDNINIANLNTQQMNMQFVMAGRGLRSRRSVCKEHNGAVGSVARFSFLNSFIMDWKFSQKIFQNQGWRSLP